MYQIFKLCKILSHMYYCVLLFSQAFFSGKLKLAGNTAMAMKLQSIMPKPEGAKL